MNGGGGVLSKTGNTFKCAQCGVVLIRCYRCDILNFDESMHCRNCGSNIKFKQHGTTAISTNYGAIKGHFEPNSCPACKAKNFQ